MFGHMVLIPHIVDHVVVNCKFAFQRPLHEELEAGDELIGLLGRGRSAQVVQQRVQVLLHPEVYVFLNTMVLGVSWWNKRKMR